MGTGQPQVVVLHGTQPQQEYVVEQESRDTSCIIRVFLCAPATGERLPFLELFLPKDTEITPELLLFTASIRQEHTSEYVRHYMERSPLPSPLVLTSPHIPLATSTQSQVIEAGAMTIPMHI